MFSSTCFVDFSSYILVSDTFRVPYCIWCEGESRRCFKSTNQMPWLPLLKIQHWLLTALRTESTFLTTGSFVFSSLPPPTSPSSLLQPSAQFSSAAAALARCLLTVLTCKLLPASVFLHCYSLYLNTGYLVASLSFLRSQFKSLPSSGKSLLTALYKVGSPHHTLLLSFLHSDVKKTDQNLKSYWLYSTIHESGSIKSSR